MEDIEDSYEIIKKLEYPTLPVTPTVEACWKAILETWCHQLLFVRDIYPHETFTTTRFLGIQCHVHCHPKVVQYISDTINVAVPALLCGLAQDISLVFVQDYKIPLETYTLNFCKKRQNYNVHNQLSISNPRSNDNEKCRFLEQDGRQMILSVHALQGQIMTELPASLNINFKLTLQLSRNINSNNIPEMCSELNEAVANGTWYAPNNEHIRQAQTDPREPIYDFETFDNCMVSFTSIKHKQIRSEYDEHSPLGPDEGGDGYDIFSQSS